MTSPHSAPGPSASTGGVGSPSSQRPSTPVPPTRFVAGAIDLGAVKAQADARQKAQQAQQAQRDANPAAAAQQSATGVRRVALATPDSFEDDLVVRSTQVPVVVLVTSQRSAASERMREAFEELVAVGPRPKWLLRIVDADVTPEVAQVFRVTAIPSVIALVQGQVITQFEGGQPKEKLEEWIAAVVGAVEGKMPGIPESELAEGAPDPAMADATGQEDIPADPRFDAAEDKVAAGDYAGAVADYDAILAAEPAGSEAYESAKAARGNVSLMARLEDGGDEWSTADELLLAGDKQAAFAVLVEGVRNPATRDSAKARLLELFGLFDAADPDVIAARTAMASALF